MLENLKNDLAIVSQAIEQRLQPQWEEPREVCHFARTGVPWTCTYRAALPTGNMGALLELRRNGKWKFSITMHRPERELGMWRAGLLAAISERGVIDIGWWTGFWLRVRGRRIDFAREVEREETAFGTLTNLDRYYLARVAGWGGEARVVIVHASKMSGRAQTQMSARSIRLLPSECRILAEGLAKLST